MDPTVRGSVAARSAAPWSPAPAPASSWHSTLTALSPGWASRPSGEKFRVVLYPCSRGGVGKRIKNLFNLSFALYLFTWSLTKIFYSILVWKVKWCCGIQSSRRYFLFSNLGFLTYIHNYTWGDWMHSARLGRQENEFSQTYLWLFAVYRNRNKCYNFCFLLLTDRLN